MLTTHRGLTAAFLTAAAVAACSSSGGSASQPPPSIAASASPATMQVMGMGQFHDVDGSATGTAELVVLPDGSTYEVILESFSIEAIEHTNVVLVSNTDVTATADIDKTKLLDLGPLKAKEGMQEYTISADMAASVMGGYHAVVIWDTEMAHAIAAAPLQ